MTPELDNDALLNRIDLLRRVLTEHEPITQFLSQQLEVDERLAAMGRTIDAARVELEESYRVIRVTHWLPDDLVFEILKVRMGFAGGFENWCTKMEDLGIECPWGDKFPTNWLRKHLERLEVAHGGIRLDGVVHEALYFEEHAAQQRAREDV